MRAKSDTLKKEALLNALTESLGVVTTACKKIGINRDTHYKWYKEDEVYRKAVDDLMDVALDFAEAKLHKKINDGDTAATIFFLKCRGKKRGYIEKSELDVNVKEFPALPKVIIKTNE